MNLRNTDRRMQTDGMGSMKFFGLLRRVILWRARQLGKASGGTDRLLALSRRAAVKAARSAAQRSYAYRELLRERGIAAVDIGRGRTWDELPILTKADTFGRFTLAELAGDLDAANIADVLTSSGSGGDLFGFKLTTRQQMNWAWFDIDLGLQDAFRTDERRTLVVNCLPMGVTFQSRAVAVANVSVRADMACAILKNVGSSFEQTILCTDPLFVRQVMGLAKTVGVDWRRLNTSVIVGEEMLAESQRDFIAGELEIDIDQDSDRMVASSFGVGELGLNLLFETRETIRMRRALRAEMKSRPNADTDGSLPTFFCFNPLRSLVEVIEPDVAGFGQLCITMLDLGVSIPLPRYVTGDEGCLITRSEVERLAASAGVDPPWLPVVALRGRTKDRRLGWPSAEAVKEAIYADPGFAQLLSGAFCLLQDDDGRVALELQAGDLHPAGRAVEVDHCIAQLRNRLAMDGRIELKSAESFRWRPMLDYERKFKYVHAPFHGSGFESRSDLTA